MTHIEHHEKCSTSISSTMLPSNLNKSMELRLASSSSLSEMSSSLMMNMNNNNNNNNSFVSTDSTLSSLQYYGQRSYGRAYDEAPSSCKSNDYYTKKRIEVLHDRLDDNQTISFLQFINYHLSQKRDRDDKRQMLVEDISKDLRNGLILIDLIEIFSSTKLKREHGRTRFHSMANVQTVLDYLKSRTPLIDISPSQIVSGNRKQTLALLWIIMKAFDFPQYRLTNTHCYVENTLLGFGQDRSTIVSWLNQILNQNFHTHQLYIKDFYIETWIEGDYLTIIIKYLVPLSTKYLTYECFNYLKELDDSNSTNRTRFQLCFAISKYCFNTITIVDMKDRTERPLFRYFTELQQNVLVIQKTNPIGKLMHSNPYTRQVFDTVIQTSTEHSSHMISSNEQYFSYIGDDNPAPSTSKRLTSTRDSMDSSPLSSSSCDTSLDLQVSDTSVSLDNELDDKKHEKKTTNNDNLPSHFPEVNGHGDILRDGTNNELCSQELPMLNGGLLPSDNENLSEIEYSRDLEISAGSTDVFEIIPIEATKPSITNGETDRVSDSSIKIESNEHMEQSISDSDQSERRLHTIDEIDESRRSLEHEPLHSTQSDVSSDIGISELPSHEEIVFTNETRKSIIEDDSDSRKIEQIDSSSSKREQVNQSPEENKPSKAIQLETSPNPIESFDDTDDISLRSIDDIEDNPSSFVLNEPETIELPMQEEESAVLNNEIKQSIDECKIIEEKSEQYTENNDTLKPLIQTIAELQPSEVSDSTVEHEEVIVSTEVNKHSMENNETVKPITISSQNEIEQTANLIHEPLQSEIQNDVDQQLNDERVSSISAVEESMSDEKNLPESADDIDSLQQNQQTIDIHSEHAEIIEEIDQQKMIANETDRCASTEDDKFEQPTLDALSPAKVTTESAIQNETTTETTLEETKPSIIEEENENQQIVSLDGQCESKINSLPGTHLISADYEAKSFQDDVLNDQITKAITESNFSNSTSHKKLEKPTVIPLPQPISFVDDDINKSTIENRELISVSQDTTQAVSSAKDQKTSTASNELPTKPITVVNRSQPRVSTTSRQPVSSFKGPLYSAVVSGKSSKPNTLPSSPAHTIKEDVHLIESEATIDDFKTHANIGQTSCNGRVTETNFNGQTHDQPKLSVNNTMQEQPSAPLQVKQNQTPPTHKSKRPAKRKTKAKHSSAIVDSTTESTVDTVLVNEEEHEVSVDAEPLKTVSSAFETTKIQHEENKPSTISKQPSNDVTSTKSDPSTVTRSRKNHTKKNRSKSRDTSVKKTVSSNIPEANNISSIPIVKPLLNRNIIGIICVFLLICFCFIIFIMFRSQK